MTADTTYSPEVLALAERLRDELPDAPTHDDIAAFVSFSDLTVRLIDTHDPETGFRAFVAVAPLTIPLSGTSLVSGALFGDEALFGFGSHWTMEELAEEILRLDAEAQTVGAALAARLAVL